MPKVKEHLKDLVRSGDIKISRSGFLRLDMNENPSGLPQSFVKEALSGVDADLLARYPECVDVCAAIALHDKIDPECITLANGSDAAIKYIFDAYISAGDKVLFTDPTFAMYPVYSRMFGAEPVIVEYNNDLTFPKESFSAKISSDIKMAVIVNPNNPTGSVLNETDLTGMIKKAADNDVLMVIDEAYFYFYPKTIITKVNDFPNLIVLRTFSKLCGMAGLRLGYAASCKSIAEDLRRVKPTFDVNSLSVLVAQKLLERPDIIQAMVKSIDEGKAHLARVLDKEGIENIAGNANFVLIKCDDRTGEIIDRLADKKILVSGRFKQDFLKNYIRVTVSNKADMDKFWKEFIAIWRKK